MRLPATADRATPVIWYLIKVSEEKAQRMLLVLKNFSLASLGF
jgi:hypothetical protein